MEVEKREGTGVRETGKRERYISTHFFLPF
jgi:hypothetical protein